MPKWFDKITDKQKTTCGILLILAAMIGGFAANVHSAMWGGENEWNLLASILYMLFWILFVKIGGRHRPLLKAAYVIGICTFISALLGSICVLSDNMTVMSITSFYALIGTVTTCQFWGLNVIGKWLHIIGIKWYYPSVTVIALCWVLYVRRKRKLIEK